MGGLGAIIPAAGLSSRMGEFKPLLEIGGRTLISHVIAMMRQAGAEPITVVTGHKHTALEARLKPEGVIVVHNTRYMHTQMLDSLKLALPTVEGVCERILVSPADVPLVKPQTVQALLRLSGEAARPVCDGVPGHPVLIGARILPVIKHYTGDGGVRGALEAAGIAIAELITDDRAVVLDCDTQADYERLLREFSAGCAHAQST